MEKVSIIIPAYNNEKKILHVVENALDQTYNNIEIIIVDDGSTDKTVEIIEKKVEKHDNLFLYKQSNSGPGVARNLGLKHSTGDYIFFADADDSFKRNMVEEMMMYAIKYDAEIIQSGYILKNEDNQTRYIDHVKTIKILSDSDNMSFEYAKGEIIDAYLWSKLFKAELIKNNFFPSYYYGEDQYFIIRSLVDCKKLLIIPENYYYYTNNPDSIVRSNFNLKKLDSLASTYDNIKFYNEINPSLVGFYHKKICLYTTTFYNEIKQSKSDNFTYLLSDLKEKFNKSYSFYSKSRFTKKNTSIQVNIWLFINRYLPFVNQIYYYVKNNAM